MESKDLTHTSCLCHTVFVVEVHRCHSPKGRVKLPARSKKRNQSLYTFKEYHDEVNPLASYPDIGNNLIYPALGLAGEAGEAVDKIKKLWRNKKKTANSQLTTEERIELMKEIGDVLWYIDALATELDVTLASVARMNSEKLNDRHKRGVIKGEGDNR